MLDQFWGEARFLLKRAIDLSDRKYTVDSIYKRLVKGDFQLWIVLVDEVMMMAGVTQIIIYPAKKVCTIMFLGGKNILLWNDTYAIFEAWARNLGCDSIEIWGRQGWQRMMKDYELIHIVLRKEL